MFFRKVLTLFACLAACSYTWASPSPSAGESKLLQAMRSTSELQQNNPSRSLECFQYYSEIFDELLQQYQQQFENCQNLSQQQQTELDDSYKPVLSSLSNSSESACQQIIDCGSQSNSLNSLACYSDVAGRNVREMYNISSTASTYYGQLEQRIQMIQFTEDQCTNSSKRDYELNTDQAYINLQKCLIGDEPVPTRSTTSTTTTTTTAASIDTTRRTVQTAATRTTYVPTTTDSVSVSTTAVPVTTDSVPVSSTLVPVRPTTSERTTEGPVSTTAVPVTTDSAPVSSTLVPVRTTTSVPVSTTSVPDSSSVRPTALTRSTTVQPSTTSVPTRRTTIQKTSRSPPSSRRTTPVPPTTSSSASTTKSLSSELKKLLNSLRP